VPSTVDADDNEPLVQIVSSGPANESSEDEFDMSEVEEEEKEEEEKEKEPEEETRPSKRQKTEGLL
jgi:hypothetical protein